MAKLAHIEFAKNLDGRWQPKRKNNWYVQLETPGQKTINTVAIKSTGLPGGSFTEVTIDYMNSKYYFPGKWEWNTIQMTMRDFVGESTAQAIYDWHRHIFNPETGAQNMGGDVKRSISLNMTDPRGNVIETWELVGAWPQAVEWGDVAYDDDGEREITVTWRYDFPSLLTRPMTTEIGWDLAEHFDTDI
jgi:hypothetical protein